MLTLRTYGSNEIRGFTILKIFQNTAKKRKSAKKSLQNQTNELYKKAGTLPNN